MGGVSAWLRRQVVAPVAICQSAGWIGSGRRRASGGIITLTREPSGRRASTMGEDSSTRRPTAETILSMMCSRCRLS